MREIKFRGKAVTSTNELEEIGIEHENGWVVSNLIQNGDQPWIVGDIIEWDDEYIAHDFWVKVHPESVGQYTGLKDKNGKEIYEGDIVNFNDFDSLRTGGYTEDNILNGEVKFLYGGWIVDTEIGQYELHNVRENDEEVEVIGNIYENPELLKEESK